MKDNQVIAVITQLLPYLPPRSRRLEDIDGHGGNAIVDDDSSMRFEQSFVALALHLCREANTVCHSKGAPDFVGIQVGHQKHFLGIVLELILRPGLMDDPNGRHPCLVCCKNCLWTHDGIHDGHVKVGHGLLNFVFVVLGIGIQYVDLDSQLLVVRSHGPILGHVHLAFQVRDEFQLPQEIEQEVVRTVSLQRVSEHNALSGCQFRNRHQERIWWGVRRAGCPRRGTVAIQPLPFNGLGKVCVEQIFHRHIPFEVADVESQFSLHVFLQFVHIELSVGGILSPEPPRCVFQPSCPQGDIVVHFQGFLGEGSRLGDLGVGSPRFGDPFVWIFLQRIDAMSEVLEIVVFVPSHIPVLGFVGGSGGSRACVQILLFPSLLLMEIHQRFSRGTGIAGFPHELGDDPLGGVSCTTAPGRFHPFFSRAVFRHPSQPTREVPPRYVRRSLLGCACLWTDAS
mmetsp:Transcript_4134/g.26113  ORF Transcript_4134/g.26113 Transcript_4134/m.26113 type:complete len:454 (-) Transcript_4134:38-1399(-)